MVKEQYMFEGSGRTQGVADKELKSDKSKLIKKLKSAKTSVKLNVVRQEYNGEYHLKEGVEGPEYLDFFNTKSETGWSEVIAKAKAHADIRNYTPIYTVNQWAELTKEQQEALAGKKKREGPTAEIDDRPNSMDFLSQLR